MAQVGMSVLCGSAVEIRVMGWRLFSTTLQNAFGNGKDSKMRDMMLLGAIRMTNILLSLVTLKYISASFSRKWILQLITGIQELNGLQH